MDNGLYNRAAFGAGAVDRASFDEGLRQHMLRVFNYMTIGLAVTGLTAWFTGTSPEMLQLLFGTPLKWVVMLAPLAFVMVMSFGINRMSASTLQMVFWAYSAVMGLSLATIFIVFTHTSIARVFFISAAMFAGASLWGYTTRRDLTSLGGFMMMGLIGVLIAGLVNMFVGSTALQFAVSVLTVIIFTGMTAYDTQSIKEMYAEGSGQEANTKLAIMGALSLYLNFINLFMALLQLIGDRE
jgi:FtsH-binding integral membrane protein